MNELVAARVRYGKIVQSIDDLLSGLRGVQHYVVDLTQHEVVSLGKMEDRLNQALLILKEPI